jgi:hypothetical protein
MKLSTLIHWLKFSQPMSRLWYTVAVPICVDVPLGASVRGRAWLYVSLYVCLLLYATVRRFLETGLSRWLALPFAIITASPYLLFNSSPAENIVLLTLVVIALQSPAMICKKGRFASTPR